MPDYTRTPPTDECMVPYYLCMVPGCGLGKEAPSFARLQLCAVETAWGAKHRLVFSPKCLLLVTLKRSGEDAECALFCPNGCSLIHVPPWDFLRDLIVLYNSKGGTNPSLCKFLLP